MLGAAPYALEATWSADQDPEMVLLQVRGVLCPGGHMKSVLCACARFRIPHPRPASASGQLPISHTIAQPSILLPLPLPLQACMSYTEAEACVAALKRAKEVVVPPLVDIPPQVGGEVRGVIGRCF